MAMNTGPEYPEILEQFALMLRDLLVERLGDRLSAADADSIALEGAERFRAAFGGQILYVPLGMRHEVMKRWYQIWSEWNGPDDTPRLAKKNRCSEVHINRIVRTMKDIEQRSRQADMIGAPALPAKPAGETST